MLNGPWVRGNQWKQRAMVALTAALLCVGAGAVARAAGPVTDDTVEAAVASAKTPADHAALAEYFTSKAQAATASAENHDKMAKGFHGKAGERMAAHCKSLAAADRKQAQDYTALAKAEQQLAGKK
jgi:hypothetical protein